ncbi:hypothetical protein Vi05172_g5231 [Venturia inaequalis]|nr:hypothetical protein Vi05172_g5231 [Venturia inaequalis]
MPSPTVGKVEDHHHLGDGDRSSISSASTPEAEGHHDDQPHHEEQQQQQKRKGGRKPIYATSEERKQRNRQAQAAFRERRTEYIKQLESTIKLHEENLQNLQQSHRSAADECLMLRYKNSLLERILLEKGIDVQAELRAKGGSPNLGPTRMAVSAAPVSQPIQRYAVSKYAQNRRSLTGMPKPDGISPGLPPTISPRIQPTPTSHISSPTTSITQSPNFLPQGGPISPSFGPISQQNQQLRPPQQQLRPQFNPPQRPAPVNSTYSTSAATIASALTANAGTGPSYYPSTFQNHYDELEQEYDQQADMLEEEADGSANAGGYPQFPPVPPQNMHPQQHRQQQRPMPTNGQHHPPLQPQPSPAQGSDGNGGFGGQMNHNLYEGGYDPMLDADPFGLSASMHFPTQFSFDATTR